MISTSTMRKSGIGMEVSSRQPFKVVEPKPLVPSTSENTNSQPINPPQISIVPVSATELSNQDRLNHTLYDAIYSGDIDTIRSALTQGADLDAPIKGIPIFGRLMNFSGEVVAHYIAEKIPIDKVVDALLPAIQKNAVRHQKSQAYRLVPYLAAGNMKDYIAAQKRAFMSYMDASRRKISITTPQPNNRLVLTPWLGMLNFYNNVSDQLNFGSSRNIFDCQKATEKLVSHPTNEQVEMGRMLACLTDIAQVDINLDVFERIQFGNRQFAANQRAAVSMITALPTDPLGGADLTNGRDIGGVRFKYATVGSKSGIVKMALKDTNIPRSDFRTEYIYSIPAQIAANSDQLQQISFTVNGGLDKPQVVLRPTHHLTDVQFNQFKAQAELLIKNWKIRMGHETDQFVKTNTINLATRFQNEDAATQNLIIEFTADRLKAWSEALSVSVRNATR